MNQYVVFQFLGYTVQIIPIIFLFYAPYGRDSLRFSKKALTGVLTAVYLAASAAAALLLGRLYMENMDQTLIVWIANTIFFLYLMAGTLVYFVSFKKETRGKILFYMFVIEYGMALYILNEIATKFVPFAEAFGPYTLKCVLIYVIATLATFPPVYYFLHRFNDRELTRVPRKNLRFITVCSIAIAALTVIGLQMEVALSSSCKTLTERIYISVFLVCILFANLLSYFIYFGCMTLEQEKEKIQSRLNAYESQYESVKKNIEKDRQMHHNLRHHFRTLSVLASEQRLPELQEYINNYLEDLNEIELRQISENSVLNSVLSYYIQKADEKGIRIRCDIQIKDTYSFDIKDMTVLLGNALENALWAAQECGKDITPHICVMVRQYKKSLLIKIENTIDGSRDQKEREKGKNRQGYGLSSIEMIAEKYQGSMETWRENGKFILYVVLNIDEGQQEESRKRRERDMG